MESTFTSEGVLVGDTEYGVYTAIARLVVVAFISDIAFRFLFAQRVGIYLVTELSVRGGIRAWFRSLYHRPNPAHSRLLACALFALAFLVTRGLDIVVTTYFSARKLSSIKRVTYVSTADLSLRPTIAGTFKGILFNRSDIYSVVKAITKDVPFLGRPTLWPEAIGMLSDAEIAAISLTPGSCVPVQDSIEGPRFLSREYWTPERFEPGSLRPGSGQSYTFFGEEVRLFQMNPGKGAQPCYGCPTALPIPFGYLSSHHGRRRIGSQSRRQFGVISSSVHALSAYDMECGWTTHQVSDWIKDHQPKSPTPYGNSSLWYNDYQMIVNTGDGVYPFMHSAFLLLSSNNFTHEYELLSFGAPLSLDRNGVRAHIVSRSVAKAVGTGEIFSDAYWKADEERAFVPLTQAPVLDCSATEVPYLTRNPSLKHFADGRYHESHLLNVSAANPSMRNGPVEPVQQCTLAFRPPPRNFNSTKLARLGLNATFFYDRGNRATEICRTRLLRYPTVDTRGHGDPRSFLPLDMVTVFRFQDATAMDSVTPADSTMRCMARDANGKPVLPRPGFAFLGNTTVRQGYLVDSASANFNNQTQTDPASPQAVFLDLVVISWIELGVIAAMVILLSAMGVWGDVAEMVALVMYAFSHQPTPPHVAHRPTPNANDQSYASMQRRALLADGLGSVQLMEPIRFAAVQLDAVVDSQTGDSTPVIDLRLVPASWGVTKGENVSLLADRPCFSGADDVELHSETGVAASGVFEQVMQTVRRLQSRKAQGDNLV